MGPKAKAFLYLQEGLGRVAIFVCAPLYFVAIRLLGYQVRDLKKIREECRLAFKNHEGPWLICANHLTMIDSMILTYAMASLGTHFFRYRRLAWNLPERDNFQRSWVLAVLCYLAKCIPVNRGGDRGKMKEVFEKCTRLLRQGQNLMIFPEGGRSRTGRVDTENYSYGVGRFCMEVEECRVMCIYLRGDGQVSYGMIPKPGERFTMSIEVFTPERPAASGLRAQRDYAGQVIHRLARMEEAYFDNSGQRHCGSDRPGKQGEEQGYTLPQPRLYRS